MLYVLTAMFRSGTSAFMRGCEAGGMEVVYSDERDKALAPENDEHYQIQHGDSVYEPALQQREQVLRNPGSFDGCAIKLLCNRFGHAPALTRYEPGYRIVILRRDPEEIRQSYMALFAGRRARSIHWLPDQYDEHMQIVEGQLAARRDVHEIVALDFRDDVVADPVAAFERTGWPLDAVKAAQVIAPDRVRMRLEDLEVGV